MAEPVDPFAPPDRSKGFKLASFHENWSYEELQIGEFTLGPEKNGLRVLVGDIVTEFDYSKGANGKKASGADGASNVNRGLKPRMVEILIEAWDGTGEDSLDDLVPILQSLENPKGRETLRVVHPKLLRHQFREAVVAKVTEVGDTPGAQTLLVRVLLREERKRDNVTHKPKKQPKVVSSPVPTIETPQQGTAGQLPLRQANPAPPRLR